MKQYLQQMVDAIAIRQSNRHFLDQSLSTEHENAVKKFITSLEVPFNYSVSISYHTVPKDTDIVYFKGPKQFIALESSKSLEEQAKLGFLGELFVLYCESIGIRTCWMGHYKKKQVHEIVYQEYQQEDDRQLYCIILIGYTPEKTGFMDRFSKRRFSRKNREIESFLHENSMQTFSKEIQYSLDLASKAPSAMNTQKWYYMISEAEHETIVEIGKIKGYRHFKWAYYDIDVGTASAHLWLGLRIRNYLPRVECSADISGSCWKFLLNIE